jgi:hypothetical protein
MRQDKACSFVRVYVEFYSAKTNPTIFISFRIINASE